MQAAAYRARRAARTAAPTCRPTRNGARPDRSPAFPRDRKGEQLLDPGQVDHDLTWSELRHLLRRPSEMTSQQHLDLRRRRLQCLVERLAVRTEAARFVDPADEEVHEADVHLPRLIDGERG